MRFFEFDFTESKNFLDMKQLKQNKIKNYITKLISFNNITFDIF